MSHGAIGAATWLISLSLECSTIWRPLRNSIGRCKNLSSRIERSPVFCFDAFMPKANLADMVGECQRLLSPETFEDWEGAVNGLQVENDGAVTRIAAAVDASLATIKL